MCSGKLDSVAKAIWVDGGLLSQPGRGGHYGRGTSEAGLGLGPAFFVVGGRRESGRSQSWKFWGLSGKVCQTQRRQLEEGGKYQGTLEVSCVLLQAQLSQGGTGWS